MPGYSGGETRTDFLFRGPGPKLRSYRRHQRYSVIATAEDRRILRRRIGDDPVAPFGLQLGLRVLDEILGFERETDHQGGPPWAGQGEGRQYVRRLHQMDVRRR